MMKTCRCFSIISCAIVATFAQAYAQSNTVSEGVFRIDGMPEAGFSFVLGAPVPLVNPDPPPDRAAEKRAATAAVDTTNLTVGPHVLEVAFDDSDGNVGTWIPSVFQVTGAKAIVAAEYFFDDDPGEGNGTAIAMPLDGSWGDAVEALNLDITIPALAPGPHAVFIRSQDQDGLWSRPYGASFSLVAPRFVTSIEWTTDPGAAPGSGNPVNVLNPPLDSAAEAVQFQVDTTGLPTGAHPEVFIRRQDSLGEWVQNPDPIIINRLPPFSTLNVEEKLILDPGVFTQIDLSVDADPDGDDPVEVTVGPLPAGAYFNDVVDLMIWTPSMAQIGIHEVEITRTDSFDPPGVLVDTLILNVGNVPMPCPDGDVDDSGSITPGDALLAFQHFLQIETLPICPQRRADVIDSTEPPSVTPGDALEIFECFLESGACTLFPQPCSEDACEGE